MPDPKKFSAARKFFWPSRGSRGMLPGKVLKYRARDWLKMPMPKPFSEISAEN